MYSAKTFDVRSKYANHQTLLTNIVNGNGNAMMIQRMKPEDAAPPATLGLALEVLADDVPVYERGDDDSLTLDQDGNPIPTGDMIPGHKTRWVLRELTDNAIGTGQSMAGSLSNAGDTAQSTIYPIADLQVADFGSHGNLKGIRLWAPTTESASDPADEEVIADQNAFLYRIQMIERPDAKSQPNVVQTMSGSQSVQFSFKEGAINTRTDSELFIDQILLDAYRDLDNAPKQFGPFNGLHVYHDNLQTILDMLYNTELVHQPEWPADADVGRHLVNIVGGKTVSGVEYHTIQVLGKAEGGIELTGSTNHYATGGFDGSLDNVTFDALVANQLVNYGDLDFNFLDSAMYPQSIIWDTGFTLDTKKKMLTPIGRRKDISVILSTQDVTTPGFRQNTAEEETSVAIALRAAARMYPESEVFGTPVCRALVVGHSDTCSTVNTKAYCL